MQYSKETKTLTIDYRFNEELKDIPEDTKVIIFQENFNLIQYSNFNQKINNFPKSLTHLTFGWGFNQQADNLPQNITHLTFGWNFNQKVDNLPQNLTHLTFDDCFNEKVDNLPQNLTHLTFGYGFNQSADNLPQNLTRLTFGWRFNKKVDNLPQNITHLTFGNCFNQKTYNLPHNLNYLKLGWRYQNKIILPKKLKELSLTCENNLINNIPEYVEKIYIYFYEGDIKKIENLPFTLKEIIIEDEKFKECIKIPFGCILTIKKLNN